MAAAIAVPLAIAWIQNMMSKSGDSGVQSANQDKLRLLAEAQQQLGNYRPQLMKAQMGAMSQRLGEYKGAKDALATMYGGGGGGAPAHPPAAPTMGVLPHPGMLGQPQSFGAMGGAQGSQTSYGMPRGPMPMPSMPMPPQAGNGPPMGTPARGLPDPMQFLGKRIY